MPASGIPLANVKLRTGYPNDLSYLSKSKAKSSEFLSSAVSKIGIEPTRLHRGIRPKGKVKYNSIQECEIKDISRRNYENLRWFHGTRDDRTAQLILANGLDAPGGINYVSKDYGYSKMYANRDPKRVFRVYLDPKKDRLFNYFDDPEEKLANKSGPISRGKLSTQDPDTIGVEADQLFHREMQHDIPDITPQQSSTALRRYGSFDATVEPIGWKPFNGEWRHDGDW